MAIAGLIIGLLMVFIFGLLVHYEAFSEIRVAEKIVEPVWMVYNQHIGDYKGSAAVMDKIYEDLRFKNAIETTRGFGLYYDNPKLTPKDRLRCIAGCLLEARHENEIEVLKKTYQIDRFPSSTSVVAEFPYKGKLSIFIGIFKVYPKLNVYLKAKNYPQTPVMEIYDSPHEKIRYIASVHLEPKVFENFNLRFR